MNFALYENKKVSAEEYKKSDNLDLRCPCCNSEVVAKQGEINIWHFAHKVKNRCSEWFKPMTEWHSNWQKCFQNECREVIHKCEKTGEKHIADIKTKNDIVIEFQHSSISSKEIKAREEFYGEKMIWVLDGNSFNIEFEILHQKDYYYDIEDILKNSKNIILNYKKSLSILLGCHEDFLFEHLYEKMKIYRNFKNHYLISTNHKFIWNITKELFIDYGDYMYYCCTKKLLQMINHDDEITEYDIKFSIPYLNLKGLNIFEMDYIFKKISKSKFLEKYAVL
jgi:competence CoiA-like predicted nuclease